MINQTIARRYAQALLAIGREDGNLVPYGQELAAFSQVVAETGLTAALTNPLYPAEARRRILDAVVAQMKPSKMIANFLGLLQDKARMAHLPDINVYYQRLVDEVNNVKRATVVTARPVKPATMDRIKETLAKLTGKTIVLESQLDPAIIGGLVTKVGDLTLDGSVRTQLKNLKESLIKG